MTESIDLDESSAHSLNCASDFKEVHCAQQQNIAKLNRGDLEDLYYQLHDENIEIKKKFNSLDSKYKIMATRVMRLSRDHKCVDSINREEDQRQLEQLRQNEAALRAKLTVLRGQLASHTRLHSAALSKMQRPRSHRCSRSCHTGHISCLGEDDLFADLSRAGSQSHRQSRPRSTSRSGSQQRLGAPLISKDQSDLVKTNAALREEISLLQERISILEKDIVLGNEQSSSRISELETELSKHLAQETAENIEFIKARRMNKQQEAAILLLQQEHQLVTRELQACKAALTLAAKDQDELCSTLMRERQRSADLQQEIVTLSQANSSIRELEEQLIDAKKENAVLKEHSNRLLQLKTSICDVHESPRGPDEARKQDTAAPSVHLDSAIDVSQKQESLKQHVRLQQELKEVQSEISALYKSILDAKEERSNLRDEYIKLQNECLRLQTDLAEPNEEKKRLSQQLIEVGRECSRLVEEISRCKSELEQYQQELASLKQLSQETKAPPVFRERNSGDERSIPPPQPTSPIGPSPGISLLHTPQLSARRSHYIPQHQPHSHPSTPRPRMGDARLALLEQTAIRSSAGSFPGVLASHGSLQERFLELCIPTNSVSSSSTPVPPVSAFADDVGSMSKVVPPMNQSSREDALPTQVMAADHSPRLRASTRPDTQWELEKCRETLRVQFNLNSIYKKEVASLNNIVQSLTASTQEGKKWKE